MIRLIVTASDELYSILCKQVRAEGEIPQRASNVLQGFKQAAQFGGTQTDRKPVDGPTQDRLSGVVIDMSLHAADTLIETLHSKQSTSGIPLLAVRCDGQPLPWAIRRLCTDVIDTDGDTDKSAPSQHPSTSEL
jgi:hypothetical protein